MRVAFAKKSGSCWEMNPCLLSYNAVVRREAVVNYSTLLDWKNEEVPSYLC